MADERVEIEIVLDDGQIKKGFAKIKRDAKKTGKDVEKSLSAGISKFGAAVAVGLLASFAVIRRLIGGLREYQKALAEVSTITELTAKQQAALRKSLIGVSAQFGTTAKEQAKAYYQIISAGITDASKANDALISANKLAIGGLTSTTTAINLLTGALNSYKQENLTAARAADIIFGTVKLGKTTVEELGSSLGLILPSAQAIGVSFEEVSGAVAQLTLTTGNTSIAVTQLGAIFTAVLKKQAEAKKFGPQVAKAFSLQALQAKGLTGFLKDLNTALGGSQEKLVKLLGRVEGSKAITALAGDGFVGLGEKIKELRGGTGAADAAFQKMNVTLDAQLNRAVAKTNAIFLILGGTTSGPLSAAIKFLNRQLDDLLFAFSEFNSIGGFFKATLLAVADAALEIIADTVVEIGKELQKIPLIGRLVSDDFANGFKNGIQDKRDEIALEIAALLEPEEVESKGVKVAKNFGNGLSTGVAAVKENIAPTLGELFGEIGGAFKTIDETAAQSAERFAGRAEQLKKKFKEIGVAARNQMAGGIGQAFGAFGKALANGDNALKAFANAFISAMGQMAIQAGTRFILEGFAWLTVPGFQATGSAMIAAGAALATFGGVLSAVGGGGGGESSAGTPLAPTEVTFPADEDIGEEAIDERETKVAINVEGTVLDPQSVGNQIAQILNDTFEAGGTRVVTT